MDEVIATAGVVIVDNGHVLLIEHGEGAGHVTGAWGIPAGGIDGDETARAAAVRELAEETGLRVNTRSLIELPSVYEARIVRKAGSAHFSVRVFATNRYEGELRASAEGLPTWVRLDRVRCLRPLLRNTAEIVELAAQALSRPGAFP